MNKARSVQISRVLLETSRKQGPYVSTMMGRRMFLFTNSQ